MDLVSGGVGWGGTFGGLLRTWPSATTMVASVDGVVTPEESQKQPHHAGEHGTASGAVIFPQLCSSPPLRLTVWCQSLLFHGKGYTAYDGASGMVVFRVDDYAQDRREGTVLMDCAGAVLLTIRRRRKLGILESWMAYKGDGGATGFVGGEQRPLFKAEKVLGIPCCKVSMAPQSEAGPPAGYTYMMNWSRQERWSKIYEATAPSALPVAEVRRKCGARPEIWLGEDVLTLEVQPAMDPAVAMALMIITHAMK